VTLWKPFRIAYIRTTDLTHGYQGSEPDRLLRFYRLWAPVYDLSVRLDPAYLRNLERMVALVVRAGDTTLDAGSGTGLGSVLAAAIAARVVAIDPSREMTTRLHETIRGRRLENVEVRQGYFPDALVSGESFDSVISSFMLAHLETEERARAIIAMFHSLERGGRLGLFAAQGEIAPTFQTRAEVEEQLSAAGFANLEVLDLSDVYRITTATRP
jgi:cyclopropane fatty-acyl-phospholipid synthase-like methyltransferase